MKKILGTTGKLVNTVRAGIHFPLDVLAAREPRNGLSKFVSRAADHFTRPIGTEYWNGLKSTENRFGSTLFEAPERLSEEAREIYGAKTPTRKLTRKEKTRNLMNAISRYIPKKVTNQP